MGKEDPAGCIVNRHPDRFPRLRRLVGIPG